MPVSTFVYWTQKGFHVFLCCYFVWFQASLKSFFPDIDSLIRHRQVVFLIEACGLMRDPTPIIHFVYENWIFDGTKSTHKVLIESMFREAGLPVPKNPLHNEWINYYNHDSIKHTTLVYVPSRSYMFYIMKAKVSCNIQHGHSGIPECTMSILFPDKAVSKNLLSVCHRICQLQAVRNLYMSGVRCEDLPEPCVFTLSKNTESLTIYDCTLPTQTLSHLIQQINGCNALQKLNLSCTNLTGLLLRFIPDPHPGLPHLEMLELYHIALNKEDLKHLLSIAHKLPKLIQLNLSDYRLTGCLSSFLKDPHPGLLELEKLNLERTALNKEDVQHLLSIAYKLPKLQELNLSRYTLKGCLSSFLPDPHPGLPQLEKLDLKDTALNKDGVQHLLSIAYKLPKLLELDLSDHDLTGCLSSFLPDPHPGLPQLEKLDLKYSVLNKEDLQHLTHLIQTHKLPGLKWLDLELNRLSEMETDVEHLIEACVTNNQRELELYLSFNDLSEAFTNKWRKRCEGTNIKLYIK